MKDTEDKAALALASAVGLPWLLLGATETGLVSRSAGSLIVWIGLTSFGALVAWSLASLKGIRAYADLPASEG